MKRRSQVESKQQNRNAAKSDICHSRALIVLEQDAGGEEDKITNCTRQTYLNDIKRIN